MLEKGWNTRLLRKLKSDQNIFAISGRCGHSLDLKETFGRCGLDIAEPLPHGTFKDIFYQTETVNRGPLVFRSLQAQALGFLDETRFRSRRRSWLKSTCYSTWLHSRLHAGGLSPLLTCLLDASVHRAHTPQHIAQQEQEYKQYRTHLQSLPWNSLVCKSESHWIQMSRVTTCHRRFDMRAMLMYFM